MPKPGVLFYFDIRPCIKRLSASEKGQLFEAILDYGEFGVEPELNGALGVAWDFIKPRLDADSEWYEGKVLQRQYAVFVREAKKRGVQPMCFDDWASMSDIERHQPTSGDIERYPNSTSNSNSNTTPISPSPTAQSTNKGNDASFSAFWNAYQMSLCNHLHQLEQDTAPDDKQPEKKLLRDGIRTIQAILYAIS